MIRNSKLALAAALAMLFSGVPGFGSTAGATQTTDPLTAYNQAIQSRDWPAAVAAAQQLVNQSATSANLNLLAKAQLNSRSPEALATFERALAAAKAEQPAGESAMAKWKDGLADIYLGEGNALLVLKRIPEAIAAYNNAAQYSSKPSLLYFNICAVSYNNGDMDGAAAACRKCLQADPTKADAWFILGSVLFANSPIDSKGNITVSAETQQALKKYLELAPGGPHAADVKEMLAMASK